MIFGSFHIKERQKIEKFNPPSQFFLKSAQLLHTIKTRRNAKFQPLTPASSKIMAL